MRSLLGLFFIIPLSAFANPQLPLGQYDLSHFKATIEKLVEVVDSRQPDARETLARLKSEGFICSRVLAHKFRCKKLQPATLNSSELAKLHERYQKSFVSFRQALNVELINDSPMLIEHKVTQEYILGIGLEGQAGLVYVHRQMPNLVKLNFGDYELVFEEETLVYKAQLRRSRGNSMSTKYVDLVLKQPN